MRPVKRRAVGFIVPGHKGHALGVIAMGQRNTGVGRDGRRRRNAGNHLERDARFGCRLQLLATTTEDKRVAPFQAHHGLARFRSGNQHLVGVVLGHGVLAGTFADANLLRVTADQLANTVGDQVVIEHDIRILKNLEATQREQPGIARPGAHQNDLPARTAGVIQFVFEDLLRRRLVTGLHQAGKASAKHTLPEATAFRHAGQTRFQMVAPVAGLLRHTSEAGRQQRFDFFPQHARQHRGGAAGGDRHQQWRAVDNRREDK